MRARIIAHLSYLILPAVAVAQDGPPAILVAPTVPPAFRLLDEPAVQKEIKLSDAQKAAAEQILQSWPLAGTGLRLGWFGYVPPDMMRAAINRRTAGFLAKDLTKEQRTRLDQIVFQLREKEFGAHQAFAMAARDLGLRPDQMEDVHTLKALRVEEIANEVTSGKRFEKVKTEVQATNGETYEKMAEMLSRAQRERLKEMRGRPFAGKASTAAKERPKKAPDPPRPAYPRELFGVYDFELRFLGSYGVRSELGVRENELDPITRAIDQWDSEYSRRELRPEGAGELSELTDKVLNTVLSEKARKRFDELMIRRRLGYGGWEAACGYPKVVQTLKITPVQLDALRSGKTVDDVLSKEQRDRLVGLVGERFELTTNVDDPVPARFRTLKVGTILSLPAPKPANGLPPAENAEAAIARDFLVLTDRLKLTAEQVKKLRALAEDEPKVRELIQKELALDDTPPVAGAGRALTAVNVVTEHYRAAVEQQCWDVLEPGQQSMARKIFGRAAK